LTGALRHVSQQLLSHVLASGWVLTARATLQSNGTVTCEKDMVVKHVALADLQLLNPHLFKPLREPTVNISQALLCTFFPPPLAPASPVTFPTTVPAATTTTTPTSSSSSSSSSIANDSLSNAKIESSQTPSTSIFSLSGVKASLGLTATASVPVQPACVAPTALAVPHPLPLPPCSQLYWPAAGESFLLPRISDANLTNPPNLPNWAAAILEGGWGVVAAACNVGRVRYSLSFASDGSKDAAAAAEAAAQGEHAASRL
jgi:hypothetical protein